MSAIRISIVGSVGRMGQMLQQCAKEDPALELAALLDVGDDLALAVQNADAVIEFSHHTVSAKMAALCAEAGCPLVIGTTGHSDEDLATIRRLSEKVPMVVAPNFSVGVNTLFWLTRKAAEILGPGFDLEVVEMHHRLKKDAPSGTAKRLAEILCEVRDISYNDDVEHGRHGIVGERTAKEIGMHAIRGGDVVGDHTVMFATNGERVELTHKASSRETFATGALRAAKWLQGKKSGLFDMQDVLGLR